MKIKGTLKELSGTLKIGDMVLGQPQLSFLTRWAEHSGAARIVGYQPKPNKGKTPAIWEIDPEFTIKLEKV